MASVFKKGPDKGRKGACYYVAWTDEHGKRRTVKAFTDKGLSEQLGAKYEQEAMLRRRGLIDPEQDQLATYRKQLIEKYVVEYEKKLRQRGNTPKYVKQLISRLRKCLGAAEVSTLGDLKRERVAMALHGFREEQDLGPRTFNHYVQAMDGFCRWLVATDRLVRNPINGVERLNAEVDVRHRRRALTAEEAGALVASARNSGISIQGYGGDLRAKLYLASYLTGLRRKELASLTPASFDLAANPPIVIVEAACSKHRKRDVLPLHPEFVELLRPWLATLGPEDHLFPKLDRKKTWLMVRKDLERVGIAYRTTEGVADFHAAGRHSHITGLLKSGANLATARGLARHGDIRMTMRYTHIGLDDQATALAALDGPSKKPAQRASGDQKRLSSAPGVAEGQNGSSSDNPRQTISAKENPCGDRGCDELSSSDNKRREWRRRESNPRAEISPRKLLRV